MVSLPDPTDMLLLLLLLLCVVVAVVLNVGMLMRVPSASFNEYVPLGDNAFFLFKSMDIALERLGEILPNGERTGDRTGDLAMLVVELRLGDNDRIAVGGDFDALFRYWLSFRLGDNDLIAEEGGDFDALF